MKVAKLNGRVRKKLKPYSLNIDETTKPIKTASTKTI